MRSGRKIPRERLHLEFIELTVNMLSMDPRLTDEKGPPKVDFTMRE